MHLEMGTTILFLEKKLFSRDTCKDSLLHFRGPEVEVGPVFPNI